MGFQEGTEHLVKEYQISLLFVTLGNEGCFFRHGRYFGKVKGLKVKAIDTTGADDAFLGGILHKVREYNGHPVKLNLSEVEEMAKFANAVAALSVSKEGGIPGMPALEEVEELLQKSL